MRQIFSIFDEKIKAIDLHFWPINVKAIDLHFWPNMGQIFEKFFFDFFSFLGGPESIDHTKKFFWEKIFGTKFANF